MEKTPRATSSLSSKDENNSTLQTENTEYNETSSLSSCITEFETFADEVKDGVPEVDFRGRVNRERSKSADDTRDDISVECSSQLSVRSEKHSGFIRTLLSSRTPYDEFHRLFKNVPKDQFPINDFSCALSRDILLQGRLYISQGWFCFYSNIFGWETQVTIDCSKIQSITREKTAYVVPNAILISTFDDKHFFSSFLSRESVYKLLIQVWEDVVAKTQEPSEEDLLDNLPFHELDEELDNNNIDIADTSFDGIEPIGYAVNENKFSSDSGFYDCQAPGILSADLETDPQSMMSFDPTLEEEINHSSSKLPSWAKIALCAASIAEMTFSYFQVTYQLLRRLSKQQLFILFTSIIIITLMCCSAFLLYRLAVLEPLVFTKPPISKAYVSQKSVHQILKLRKEVYDAEVMRVQKIVSANLEAISQISETLKMLQEDLANQLHRNCTVIDKNVCVNL
ncbi:GRAM domain-containing protein 2A isoform X2 [Exaiptasia diaphana]|nr:GRAM domain-containing protein 2A isoform X2 [Exaiptasia diaphana]KXJ25970.1 GRAM domain-containing protein 1B [Exaiptasia diaphana]